MPRVLVTPKYAGEYGPCNNRPCTPEIAAILEAKARLIAVETASEDFMDVTLMTQPRRSGFLVLNPKHRQRKLVASTRDGKLKLIRTHIRTYGISPDGQLFVGREYAEVHGTVFVSLHPLLQCTLDLGVLEYELLQALDKMLV
jgi:hypothetical protein